MDNKTIIDGLLNGDENIHQQFFFEDCRPLFTSIIASVFPYHVEYEEFVNELYIYLMEDDAARLKQFGGRSSIYQWLKTLVLRFALRARKRGIMIDMAPKDNLYNRNKEVPSGDEPSNHAKMDLELLLSKMGNERQTYVIRRHIIDGIDERTIADELGVKVSNLYNIKKRAIKALSEVALTDIQQYGKTSK